MQHKLVIKVNHRMSVIDRNILPKIFFKKKTLPSVAKAAKKGNTIATIANKRHMQLLIDTTGA